MRCTEVADRPFFDGKFFGRDIGDRGRYDRKIVARTNDCCANEMLLCMQF